MPIQPEDDWEEAGLDGPPPARPRPAPDAPPPPYRGPRGKDEFKAASHRRAPRPRRAVDRWIEGFEPLIDPRDYGPPGLGAGIQPGERPQPKRPWWRFW